jgi:hypothetical protein
MNIINKEYFWNIKNNFIYIYKYKKNINLKIIFINKDDNEENNMSDFVEEDEIEDEEEDEIEDEEEDEIEEEEDEEEDEENIDNNINNKDKDIVININNIYDEDNIDYLNAKNLLNNIILPRTFSYKHLIVPIQFYKNNNKIIVLGSYAITNLELLKTLYEFYNVKVLSTDELEEINNDDYWNYVDNAKELKNPHYLNTLGLLTNFEYIERIENDIFRFELNKV